MRKFYVVEVVTTQSKKPKQSYPTLALCETCVGKHFVISEGERTYQACAECGEDD
ncbi:hypothetical protein VIOR3934_19140 [Vibrio orientalis CIP 102891 = ATCC 33934]|uniref:Uncharacterized protein n=1 Tax=Vibrio orientalis CIP 102891 = ATCC 33934 TaxID=675816 RepID=F9SMB8_VIBOR|nr:hypothetical protein [Vibrio orientalis]EGU53973.1 hypothetical protein VIOR3934_19140 [Vibrio orientalis CIP 102891 = ATCC 33934]